LNILDKNGRLAGVIDTISGAPMPVLRVVGWTTVPQLRLSLRTSQEGGRVPYAFCRLARPDVVAAGAADEFYNGFRADFHLREGETPSHLMVEEQEMIVPNAASFGTVRPHYEGLFTEERVLHRNDIYGYGPPTDSTEQHKALFGAMTGAVLDFGCGNGDALLALRANGCDARGVELDTPRVQFALKPEARPFTTLYEGGVPLPFADSSFDWIVSSEVIEHIADIEIYVGEFARLLRPGGKLFLTTPDISSIPSSYPLGMVPWHLLESTHVRFFTPISLRKMLASHFDLEVAYSIGDNQIHGWLIPGSTAGVFKKRAF